MNPRPIAVFGLCILLILSGCSSGLTRVAPHPPDDYRRLGRAEGKACGALGILGTAYYFIPMGLNSRVDRAYADALRSVPGATALVDVELRENWYWWVIGTSRCVTIRGEAVR